MNDKSDTIKLNDFTGFVKVKGAREHNLKNVDVIIPRDALVVFTGISGSGKSSLAFGTLYAEAQKRYLESVSPYARRLFHQMPVPDVDEIDGLPPAVALQQQRGSPSTRSSVGSVTTLSNLFRMLYSRAGDYPKGQQLLYAESFSANTPEGACPTCHGIGRVFEVTEASMVLDDSLTIAEKAISAWPSAWQGQNLRDILTTLGYDIHKPWKEFSPAEKKWILFTDEQPQVPVYAGYTIEEVKKAIRQKRQPDYMGTFTSARKYVLHTFANTQSQMMKKRVSQFMVPSECETCKGKRLRKESLSVTFCGYDITEISRLSFKKLMEIFTPFANKSRVDESISKSNPEKIIVTQRIAEDIVSRLQILINLGLSYLSMERSTPSLSPGELQRLRLATQVRSNLFGVVYVLDEPSAGLHPADTEALLNALYILKKAGNSLFVVEHELDIINKAEWIIDVGPLAGEKGGEILYSGPPAGLSEIKNSQTAKYLFLEKGFQSNPAIRPSKWIELTGITRNNLHNLAVKLPLHVLTSITGISGSGKSTLISQVLMELVMEYLGKNENDLVENTNDLLEAPFIETTTGRIIKGMENIQRCVQVDQKPIGRTPRSNLATYTSLFDHVRRIFSETPSAKAKHFDAGMFSFNVAKGRCENCKGEGSVMVELLFLPSVYAPCPVCNGTRYNKKALQIKYRGKNIAEILQLTVDEAYDFFIEDILVNRALKVLQEVGLGYIRLGQPATELSGGEAQRIKLATELQRVGKGNTLYILDEPTTGLHPSDVEKLLVQLRGLVDAGNSVIVVEHDMRIVSASDWVIDIGPGAGEEGGKIVAEGPPESVSNNLESKTAPYLKKYIEKYYK